MTFLEAVNRVLRSGGIIRGDTDPVTTFADLQHGATLNLAIIAIQDELNDIVSDKLIPYEKKTTGTITTVSGTRSYTIASDFLRFYGTAMLYCSADNFQMFEYRGGEDALKLAIPNYKTVTGTPYAWYFEATTSKKISFYQVPDAAKTYTFDYEGSVAVSAASDAMPFHNDQESQTFCRIATRRFLCLYEQRDVATLQTDAERLAAKTVLADLMLGKNQPTSWAPAYR